MVATDILLALLINVATGELCKAFAFQIAKFWNFKAPSLADSVTSSDGERPNLKRPPKQINLRIHQNPAVE